MKPSITVIIPAHNEAVNLARLLPFLRKHDDKLITEIIVSDGLSNDTTQDVCQQNNVTFITNEKMGRGIQLQTAATYAKSEFLWFLHADTLPPITFANDLKSAISSNHTFACFRYKFDTTKSILKINAFFTRFPMMWCRGGDQSLFISQKIYDAIGGYDSNDIIMEDYNIIKRGKKAGFKLHIISTDFKVSDRKYKYNSYLRVNLSNFLVFNLWRMGVAPSKLKALYHRLIKHPMDLEI